MGNGDRCDLGFLAVADEATLVGDEVGVVQGHPGAQGDHRSSEFDGTLANRLRTRGLFRPDDS